jgi:hypothetical protein
MEDSNSLPNAIIAGVNKAGTTSLFKYVGQHPSIGTSKVKETCYFLPLRNGQQPDSLAKYRAQFDHVTDKPIRMEATPGYFYGGIPLIEKVEATLGDDLRIVIVFRDPVGRLLSFFRSLKQRLLIQQSTTLEEYVRACRSLNSTEPQVDHEWCLRGVEESRFAKYVGPWIDTFGSRVCFLFADHLHERPRDVLQEVFSFFEVSPSYASEVNLARENRSVNYRSRWVQQLTIGVNNMGERFWRAFPELKRAARSVYYWINGKPFSNEYDPGTIALLEQLYKPYNRALRRRLEEHGHYDFPEWLAERD